VVAGVHPAVYFIRNHDTSAANHTVQKSTKLKEGEHPSARGKDITEQIYFAMQMTELIIAQKSMK
jgi:hypothetical protein